MTRDEIMKLKKPELRLALANELIRNKNLKEYVKDKREELTKLKEGVDELRKAYELAMLQMAIQYGGDDHTIVLHKIDLNGWTADVDRDSESGTIMIRAKKEEKK